MGKRSCSEQSCLNIAIETQGVPAWNGTDNIFMRDVVGNKLDNTLGDSMMSRVRNIWNLNNMTRSVYPNCAAGIPIVSANANWAFGGYATIVAAGALVNPYHVHSISLESVSHDGAYQLELYHGAGDILATAIRFAQLGGFFGNAVYNTGSASILGGERLRARIAYSAGLANIATVVLSISYIEHVP